MPVGSPFETLNAVGVATFCTEGIMCVPLVKAKYPRRFILFFTIDTSTSDWL